jgi:hypothetical protein
MNYIESSKSSFYWLIIVIGLLSCSGVDSDLPAGIRGESFRISDQQEQTEVLDEMSDQKIPYKVDTKGFVHYLLKDQAEVFGIQRRVRYGETLDPNLTESTILPNKDVMSMYTEALLESRIPYKTHIRDDGWYEISWSQADGPRVDQIREDAEFEIMKAILERSKKVTN